MLDLFILLGGREDNTEATTMYRVYRQVSAEGTQDTAQAPLI